MIDALEDQRFTRSVRSLNTPPHVLRVGDCAEEILKEITGQQFYQGRAETDAMVKDGQAATTKENFAAWWRDVQKKGEKQLLIEATACGANTSPAQARRLRRKYPEAALDAIRQGVRQAREPLVVQRLIAIAADLKTPEATGWLLELLRSKDRTQRVAAAKELVGHAEALQAMIVECNRNPRGEIPAEVIGFLLKSGNAGAVQAVAKNLRQRPIETAAYAIQSASSIHAESDQGTPGRSAVQDAIDRLLIEELDDHRQYLGWSFFRKDQQYTDPLLCDLSAEALMERWKLPPTLRFKAKPTVRKQQRLELKNTWLTRHGQSPLAPEDPMHRLSDREVLPLVQRLEKAPSKEAGQECKQALVALGLSALPALRARLESLAQDSAVRQLLSETILDIANLVTKAQVEEDSPPLPADFRARLQRLEGRPLDATALARLAADLCGQLPAGAIGVECRIERDDDDTGLRLSLGLVSGTARVAKNHGGWDDKAGILVDGERVYVSAAWTNGGPNHFWSDFRDHLQSVLEGASDSWFVAAMRTTAR